MWAGSAVAVTVWIYQSGLDVLSPILVLCLGLNTLLVLPFLVDRLIAARLAGATGLLATLVFPASRTVAEYLVATFSPAGAIMGSLAATQHGNLPLLQFAAITGGYGISFLIAWSSSVGNWIWEQGLSWRRVRTVVLAFGTALVLVYLYGAVRLAFVPPSGEAVRVAGVSPYRPLLDERAAVLDSYPSPEDALVDPAPLRRAFDAVNDDLLAASEREARAGARLIVWPEVGAITIEQDKADLIASAAALARTTGTFLLMGVGVLAPEPPHLRNQAILVDPTGRVVWVYDKANPVPGMEDLVPGDGRVPTVDTPFGRVASVICFDADFPGLMRQGGRDGVDMMLIPSNDWQGFGEVHAQKAILRAVENGYSIVRPDTQD